MVETVTIKPPETAPFNAAVTVTLPSPSPTLVSLRVTDTSSSMIVSVADVTGRSAVPENTTVSSPSAIMSSVNIRVKGSVPLLVMFAGMVIVTALSGTMENSAANSKSVPLVAVPPPTETVTTVSVVNVPLPPENDALIPTEGRKKPATPSSSTLGCRVFAFKADRVMPVGAVACADASDTTQPVTSTRPIKKP